MTPGSKLTIVLGRRRLDADAAAFITARRAAGETWTTPMKSALNTFVKTEKQAGRWSLLRRIYLPTSGIAAANAIDLVSRASGTWTGGVTHAAGYVQGNGTTGYFDTGVSIGTMGLTGADASIFRLCPVAGSVGTWEISGIHPGSVRLTVGENSSSPGLYGAIPATTTNLGPIIGERRGVAVMSCTSTTSRFMGRRTSAGWSVIASNTTLDAGALSNINPYFLASNSGAGAAWFSNARFGAFGAGLGLSQAAADAFSLSIKTLWETLTGLSLP